MKKMNSSKFMEEGQSSRIQKPTNSSNNQISIENVESSVQNLFKTWNRRKKWDHFFNQISQEDNEEAGNLNATTWRSRIAKFLESNPITIIILLLLLVDIIVTILELSSSIRSCNNSTTYKSKNEQTRHIWYHWIGISILGILSTRILALMVSLGAAFFRKIGHIVDGCVVIGTLLLEAFLEVQGGGLLMVVSLWRIVKVVESAFELSAEAIEEQIKTIVKEFEALKGENTRLQEDIAMKDEIIEKLEEEISQCRHVN